MKEWMTDPWSFLTMRKRKKLEINLMILLTTALQPEENVSFYRQLNPENIEDYSGFNGQTRNAVEAIY